MIYDMHRNLIFFFFSSRRRHTRFDCDWSSDVCSSDLDNAKCWETEQRFDTMEIHEHGFLLLALCSSRILRGIRCLSITGSQPLPIGLRRWPQTWRRAEKRRYH